MIGSSERWLICTDYTSIFKPWLSVGWWRKGTACSNYSHLQTFYCIFSTGHNSYYSITPCTFSNSRVGLLSSIYTARIPFSDGWYSFYPRSPKLCYKHMLQLSRRYSLAPTLVKAAALIQDTKQTNTLNAVSFINLEHSISYCIKPYH